MATTASSRAEQMRRFLAHARERLGLDLGFHLWDGSTVPADLSAGALAIRLADENLVAAMIRRPGLETLANLWVSKRIDIVNGTLFDLVQQRPTVKTRAFRKSLDKGLALKTTLMFLTLPCGGPWPLETQPDERPSDGSPAENQQNIAYHYDVSNAFSALFLDREMVYTCGYATDWDIAVSGDLDRMQADKLEMICRKLRLRPGDHLLDIGSGWGALVCHAAQHHGVTCRLWHDRLLANHDAAVAEVGEPKTRLWLAYLGACSIAFERNTVGMFQTVATRKQRGASGMPPTRADLYR